MSQRDLHLSDGRALHIYDTHADDAAASLAIFWHHGTPNLGEPPEPLLPAAARRYGISRVYWYTWLSSDSGTGDQFAYAGLRTVNSGLVVAKPAFGAFVRAVRGLER